VVRLMEITRCENCEKDYRVWDGLKPTNWYTVTRNMSYINEPKLRDFCSKKCIIEFYTKEMIREEERASLYMRTDLLDPSELE
jgi:hypothetical protein